MPSGAGKNPGSDAWPTTSGGEKLLRYLVVGYALWGVGLQC